MRETSRDYRRPYRPVAVRWANRLLPSFGSLDREHLLAASRARTGLEGFGDADFLEPLDILLDSIRREARLSAVGRLITRERLIGILANRQRTFAAQDVQTTPLKPPLVIVGLQRTGTTLLHRLLSADPRRRWLASWEALQPASSTATTLLGADARIAAAVRAESALRYLAPDFFAVHPVQAYGCEEDVLLLDQAFLSTTPEATMHVPTYAQWLECQDQTPAYRLEARLLRLLSQQRGAEKRWLLKTPHHLEWLDTLLDVFGDADIVWTHRDPTVTVPSFCSMVAHGRGVFSDHVDPVEVGRHWLAKTARMVERAMAVRDGVHASRFLDVRYEDLVRDPLGEVIRLYDRLGEPLTDEAERRMRRVLAAHPQHRHGVHRYDGADFGLTADAIAERFQAYRERFAS